MKESTSGNDVVKAQKICEQLQEKNYDGDFLLLVNELDGFFRKIAKKRAYPDVDYEGIVNDFWIDLQRAKIICNFKGENKASLKTYLTKILVWRIKSANKKQEKYRDRFKPTSAPELIEMGASKEENRAAGVAGQDKGGIVSQSSEDIVVLKNKKTNGFLEDPYVNNLTKDLRAEIVRTALLKFSELRPDDADLVRYRLKGFSYETIAELFGARGDKEKRKKAQTLRKQFTRKNTGSLARFGIVLRRCLQEKGIKNFKDLFED